jgi:hypothetical protein
MFNSDANRSTDEILIDIKNSSIVASNNHNSAPAFPPFAALLVRLSRDAAETADKNIKIQKRLILLTLIVLAISGAMLVFQVLQYVQSQ